MEEELELIRVELTLPAVGEQIRWEAESLGLLAATIEGGLASMPGVIPTVHGRPPAPGLELRLTRDAPLWTGALTLEEDGQSLRAGLTLCGPERGCMESAIKTRPGELEAAARSLLKDAAVTLDRPVDSALDWAVDQSGDSYARLLLGRSAATWYGLRAPTPERDLGDTRRDPISRAVRVDPGMVMALWLDARRWLHAGEPAAAARALRYDAASTHPLTSAALSVALSELGLAAESAERWAEAVAASPERPSLRFGEVAALIDAGQLREARELLDAMPEAAQTSAVGLELRLMLRDRAEEDIDPDGDLADWQALEPENPEPVRLRVRALVEEGRYEEALVLTEALSERSAEAEARSLELALSAELDAWGRAARAAGALNRAPLEEAITDSGYRPPTLSELDALLERAEGLVMRTEVFSDAAAQHQNALARRLSAGDDPCEEALAGSLLTRTRRLAGANEAALRALQDAAGRLSAARREPTIYPLLDGPHRERLLDIEEALWEARRRWSTMVAYQERLLPLDPDCAPALDVRGGMPQHALLDGDYEAVAVLSVGEGRVCPEEEVEVWGDEVYLLKTGRACFGDDDCSCAPEPQRTGAVLGAR